MWSSSGEHILDLCALLPPGVLDSFYVCATQSHQVSNVRLAEMVKVWEWPRDKGICQSQWEKEGRALSSSKGTEPQIAKTRGWRWLSLRGHRAKMRSRCCQKQEPHDFGILGMWQVLSDQRLCLHPVITKCCANVFPPRMHVPFAVKFQQIWDQDFLKSKQAISFSGPSF